MLPHQRGERVGHIALDIGGSLIKLVYFSPAAGEEVIGGGGGAGVEGGGGGGGGERPRSATSSDSKGAAAASASSTAADEKAPSSLSSAKSSPSRPRPPRGGKLHFVKFETSKIDECLDFIEAKGLHRPQQGMAGSFYGASSSSSNSAAERRSGGGGGGGSNSGGGGGTVKNQNSSPAPSSEPPTRVRVLATGGGAYRFADLFRSRLGVILEKEDEMDCLVAGADFLLRAVRHEAFTFLDGTVRYHRGRGSGGSSSLPPSPAAATATGAVGDGTNTNSNDPDDPYPYLLVNIGSGVSMVRVDGPGDNEHARVSGSSLGGGTFWGLCRLLTGARSFDEMLELSSRGDNTRVDMLVGDIYGKDRDYSAIGLAASTIASSFGKAAAADLDLECYDRADVAMALCRMVSYNIGHLAYLNAKRYGLSRVFFGKCGFFFPVFWGGSRLEVVSEREEEKNQNSLSLFLLLLFPSNHQLKNQKKTSRRLLHPRAPLHHGDDQLRDPLLVERRDGGELPSARRVFGGCWCVLEGAPVAFLFLFVFVFVFVCCCLCFCFWCSFRSSSEWSSGSGSGSSTATSADAADLLSRRQGRRKRERRNREAQVRPAPSFPRGPGPQERRGCLPFR